MCHQKLCFVAFTIRNIGPNILPFYFFQFPRRPRQTRGKGLPADRAGHPEDEGEDDGHRGGPLLLQEPQLQAVRRRRTAIRTEEMDPLF